MQRTSLRTLVLVMLVTAAVAWTVLRVVESTGAYVSPVPWIVDAALVVLALGVLWAGWTVRQYIAGDRPSLSGVRAGRTLILAKAASLAGSLLTGWYGSQVLLVAGQLGIEARADKAVAAGVATLCAVGLVVAGLVAEHWCRVPPSDQDDEQSTRGPEEESGEAGAHA
ncbi:Protein of unknown function [Paraoerskovia marina]|uniref:DUF3180 domain-containing protein n=1 Tax=Paraoerskovia marina TaxID=545619 RepID=A0A1H1PXH3_9CELL|nr:DUF3180 domain-containing protein [Paraoerskovia marina]SDS15912.1 Protein of unknown function [Paraoerskovia marina]